MVRLVIDHGWTIEAAADKFQVDAKTVTKWRDRFLTEGDDGLFDRSNRPKSSPNASPPECSRRLTCPDPNWQDLVIWPGSLTVS